MKLQLLQTDRVDGTVADMRVVSVEDKSTLWRLGDERATARLAHAATSAPSVAAADADVHPIEAAMASLGPPVARRARHEQKEGKEKVGHRVKVGRKKVDLPASEDDESFEGDSDAVENLFIRDAQPGPQSLKTDSDAEEKEQEKKGEKEKKGKKDKKQSKKERKGEKEKKDKQDKNERSAGVVSGCRAGLPVLRSVRSPPVRLSKKKGAQRMHRSWLRHRRRRPRHRRHHRRHRHRQRLVAPRTEPHPHHCKLPKPPVAGSGEVGAEARSKVAGTRLGTPT